MLSVAPYHVLVVGVLAVAIFSSSIIMLSPLPNQPSSAFATFPGENGKIAFVGPGRDNPEIYVMNADGSGQTRLTDTPRAADRHARWSPDGTKIAFTTGRHGDPYAQNEEIYVMNADGSGQTRLTDNPSDDFPDWGTAPSPPPSEEDTTPPVLTVPDDMVVEATSAEGAEVTYTVTAQDNVDGNDTLEEDGTTITQDDVGGDITISCDPPSGSVFPIGNTTVQCRRYR
jgi:dipeptidyl aminopeptidase/acylaminoacyl peptidase